VPASHDWTPHDPSLVHAFVQPQQPAEAVPPVAGAEDAALPRFAIVVSGAQAPGNAAATREDGHADVLDGDGEPMAVERATTRARLVSASTPGYPPAARAQGIEADVTLEIVVGTSGRVESARTLRDAGFGFDAAAATAIRDFRFSPATIDGRPVRVRMRWSISFRLK
jgi:protein TonB